MLFLGNAGVPDWLLCARRCVGGSPTRSSVSGLSESSVQDTEEILEHIRLPKAQAIVRVRVSEGRQVTK